MADDSACGRKESDEERRERVNAITRRIIGAAQEVSRVLGIGFLEKVYENALAYEMRKGGLAVAQQQPIEVRYDGEVVGTYIADLLVEGCVLVELKAVQELDDAHHAQCINYLRATGLSICILLNFGVPRLEIARKVHSF